MDEIGRVDNGIQFSAVRDAEGRQGVVFACHRPRDLRLADYGDGPRFDDEMNYEAKRL